MVQCSPLVFPGQTIKLIFFVKKGFYNTIAGAKKGMAVMEQHRWSKF